MAPEREPAERLLADLRVEMRRRNVYRARAISLHQEPYRPVTIRFHELPKIGREQIILPEGVLERVEAQTIVFGRHAVRLREAGRHLRRGLLLHGPPGTGKTLTAMYLAGQLEERTAILLTGAGLGLIERSVALARILQPSLVVLEDVDLVAEDRARQTTGCNTILFELLNQMDGLAEDADVIFLLTSNRPDLLEPALASRPGRVDQAIEIPLPDETCRRRLFELYADGLQLDGVDFDRLVERTRGVSGAFIRELLRKAALFAADESEGAIVVRGPHLDSALHELVVEGGQLTKSFLGFAPPPAA
jgi:ATP-dependent 26S proteasome regulatory subunit